MYMLIMFFFPDFNWTSYALIYHDYNNDGPSCIVVPKVSLQIANFFKGKEEAWPTHHLILIDERMLPNKHERTCVAKIINGYFLFIS